MFLSSSHLRKILEMFSFLFQKKNKSNTVSLNTIPEINDALDVSTIDTGKCVINNVDMVRDKTVEVLDILRNVLSKSYGPLGSNTLIDSDGNGTSPVITKDGYTIIKSLKFQDSIGANIHTLIKQVSNNLVRKVGDGSTSAVISASILYKYFLELSESFMNKKDFIELLNVCEKYIEQKLDEKLTYYIDSNNKERVLRSIAQISNNNDETIGKFVSDLMIKLPSTSTIKIEKDRHDYPGLRTQISYGFTYNRGISHALFLQNKPSITIDEPLIFATYEYTVDLYNLTVKLSEKFKRSIIVLTENIYNDTETLLIRNHMSKATSVYVVKTGDISSEELHNEFIDLAIYLDSDVVSNVESFREDQLGEAKSVELGGNRCIFNNGKGFTSQTEFYTNRLKDLEEEIWTLGTNNPLRRGRLRLRVNQLQGINATILVGGRTDEEKSATMFLVEDSVLACKSAMEKGYTLGGNLAIYYAVRELLKDINDDMDSIYCSDPVFTMYSKEYINSFILLLSTVYFEVYWTIFSNISVKDEVVNKVIDQIASNDIKYPYRIFNIKTGEIENIDETNVLAPVDTDKQIMKATFSIIGMLLSINQFIS